MQNAGAMTTEFRAGEREKEIERDYLGSQAQRANVFYPVGVRTYRVDRKYFIQLIGTNNCTSSIITIERLQLFAPNN